MASDLHSFSSAELLSASQGLGAELSGAPSPVGQAGSVEVIATQMAKEIARGQ